MKSLIFLTAAAVLHANASAAVVCSVNSTGTAFGGYDTISGVPKDVVGTISVTCTGSIGALVNYTIALGPGGGGTFASRSMQGSTPALSYNLYSDGGHTVIWGDGTGGSSTLSGTFTLGASTDSKNITVYGEIPAQTGPKAGSYNDSVTVTLTYF